MKIPKNPYQLEADKLLEALEVMPKIGLNKAESLKRQKLFGSNQIEKPVPISTLKLFFRQFTSPLVYLLIFVALLSFWAGNILDTWVIIGVVILNAVVGFFQEYKAEKAALALKQLLEENIQILSSGKRKKISTTDLVPGDIVFLEAGVKVPADLRVFYSHDLRMDESILTGESTLVEKTPAKLGGLLQVSEQKNMLFAGTIVVSGVAKAVVVSIGKDTEFGKIAESIREVTLPITPLQKRLRDFSSILLKTVLVGGAAILVVGLFRGFELFEMLFVTSAAIVSAIPEGLPAVVTITLAIGVSRMTKRSAIVKKLSAVETLGSVSLIACDKTGTLTYNRMSVVEVFTPTNTYRFEGDGLKPEGKIKLGGKDIAEFPDDLSQTLKVSVLCNNAFLFEDNKEWKAEGDPTEVSLVVAAKKAGIDKEELVDSFVKLDEIPFATEYHYMATLHSQSKGKALIAVKGTIEEILKLCNHYYLKDNQTEKLTPDIRERIIKANENLTLKSQRVVAIAFKEAKSDQKTLSHKDIKNLVFIGLAGMIDPPRKESFEALRIAHKAGVDVIMLTGDHPLTAQTIAKQLGIIRSDKETITGYELNKLSDEELVKKFQKIKVFARILPQDKLRITRLFQEQGHVVAVTGDGVNDVPALKKADIGIAMGKVGTDLARESSELVLLDDNFATIVSAIEEGRKVFQNIKRVVLYLVSTNAGEMLVIVFGLLLGLPLPLTPLQILWINLVTDGTSDIALACEPKHRYVLDRPPNKKTEPILDSVLWIRVLIVAVIMTIGGLLLYYWALCKDQNIEYARTVLFMVMVVFQLWNVFNCRSLKYSISKLPFFSNPYVVISVILSIALALLTVYTPWGQQLFSTTALGVKEWILIVLVSSPILFVVEIEKAIRLKLERRWQK